MPFHVFLCYGKKFRKDFVSLNNYVCFIKNKIKTETLKLIEANMKTILESAWANTAPAFYDTTGAHVLQLDGILIPNS